MKPWYKQRTLWAGAALIVTGVGEIVAEGDWTKGIVTVAAGLALVGLRGAIERLIAALAGKYHLTPETIKVLLDAAGQALRK